MRKGEIASRCPTFPSHGTAEQIYLLLRVALAEHLAKEGESCPLLLDDVTLRSDKRLKITILEISKALSADRQVALFTQKDEVLEWAGQNLQVLSYQVQVPSSVQIAS